MLRVGEVYRVWVTQISPPNNKYIVCVEPERRWFLMINSEPRRRTPAANVLIAPADLPALTHDSYLDTSGVRYFNEHEVEEEIIADPSRQAGQLPNHVLRRIAENLNGHGHMPQSHREAVLACLASAE